MRKTILIFSLLFFIIPSVLKCQTDSVEIHKISDTYIEIKSLRYVLDSGYARANGEYVVMSFMPRPIALKNGTVIIRDRLNKPLAIYIYSDSVQVVKEHYYPNGQIEYQRIHNQDKSLDIDKWYWKNGNLNRICYYGNGLNEVHLYSEEGELIEQKK